MKFLSVDHTRFDAGAREMAKAMERWRGLLLGCWYPNDSDQLDEYRLDEPIPGMPGTRVLQIDYRYGFAIYAHDGDTAERRAAWNRAFAAAESN